jgi:hypothetical protein
MNHTIKLCLAVAGALAFAACGPGAQIGGDKQGAAEALYAAGAPAAGSTNATGQPINITLTGDTTVSCRYGGTAELKNFSLNVDTSAGATEGATFSLVYNKCGAVHSAAGVAVFDGTFTVNQAVVANGSGASVKQSFKGKVTVGGAFSDFLDANITESVDATKLTATSGGVDVSLIGTLADDSGSYTYDESVAVTADNLTVKVMASKQ